MPDLFGDRALDHSQSCRRGQLFDLPLRLAQDLHDRQRQIHVYEIFQFLQLSIRCLSKLFDSLLHGDSPFEIFQDFPETYRVPGWRVAFLLLKENQKNFFN
jgi:hypothetical protein